MSLGGGTFLVQNKVLPGSYINFISAARASANLSDRGYAAMGLELDWGIDGEVFTVELGDFQKDSLKIFGYSYTSVKLKGLRDLFLNAKTLYAYRLNSGQKAQNDFCTAKYTGLRGNDITITIGANVDNPDAYDVVTLLDGTAVDSQTVENAAGLKDNDYVIFKKDASLTATAGAPLTGGTNGTVTGESYQAMLDKLEAYSFNTLGCLSTEETVKSLFVSYTKRLREDMGVKFQTVLYNKAADFEGVINLKNSVEGDKESSLVYWLTGASAGCAVNKSNTNNLYDGEFQVQASFQQSQLETAVKGGELVFHRVGNEIRVLDDVNSFTSVSVDKNEDFQMHQVVRVLDQIGNDIAVLFNTKYLGKVPNDNSGRIALWSDLVTYNQQLEQIRAIENFAADELIVEKGNDKKSVVVTNPVTPVVAMSKLYMTVVVQ